MNLDVPIPEVSFRVRRIEFDEVSFRDALAERPELVRATLDDLGIKVSSDLNGKSDAARLKLILDLLRDYLKPLTVDSNR